MLSANQHNRLVGAVDALRVPALTEGLGRTPSPRTVTTPWAGRALVPWRFRARSAALACLLPLPGCDGTSPVVSFGAIVGRCLGVVLIGYVVCALPFVGYHCGLWVGRRYRTLSPVPRRLLRGLGICMLIGIVNETWVRWAPLAGIEPAIVTLGTLGLFVLLARSVVVLALDAQRAVEEWLVGAAKRCLATGDAAMRRPTARAERAVSLPVTRPVTSTTVNRARIEAGPTCWTCGGANDGHQH